MYPDNMEAANKPKGRPSMKIAISPARDAFGRIQISRSTINPAGAQLASPIPTPMRVSRKEVVLSRQSRRGGKHVSRMFTPIPISRVRSQLSVSLPSGTDQLAAYTSVNTVESKPSCVSLSPNSMRIGSPKRAGDLPVEEIHQVDAEQYRQREARVPLLFGHDAPFP